MGQMDGGKLHKKIGRGRERFILGRYVRKRFNKYRQYLIQEGDLNEPETNFMLAGACSAGDARVLVGRLGSVFRGREQINRRIWIIYID